ncbi:MAG: hypothetical protein JSW60_08850, partial [Thermoplasmatales archaeon]
MIKKIIGILLCVLLIIPALSATTVKSFEPADSTEESISYSYTFIEPTFQTVKEDNSYYTNINIPGCLAMGRQAGVPTMPVKFIKLLLPPMNSVSNIGVVGAPVEIELGSIDLK